MKYLSFALSAAALIVACLALYVATTPRATPMLDSKQSIIVRYETLDGKVVAQPTVEPLWLYIEGLGNSTAARQIAFETAFEEDLHAHDLTFHHTHEQIDGRKW
jgi:hypothetical protein